MTCPTVQSDIRRRYFRKARTSCAIWSAAVSSAKWPASRTWTSAFGTDLSWGGFSSLVTNADQGVAVALDYNPANYCSYVTFDNWYNVVRSGCVPEQDFNRLLLISGGAVVSDSSVNVTNPEGVFTPILQAEDGTYFGTGVSAQYSMDAFDLSGNVKWSVPAFTPVMAAADGGVIARSGNQYVTFDQNGVANGMMAQSPTYSWLGNAYQLGSADPEAAFPPHYAASFWAMPGGSNSPAGTAVHQTPLPPLPSCGDPTLKNPPACPGPAEVASSGFAALKKLVSVDCPLCRQVVFAKLPGGSVDGGLTVQNDFKIWLAKTPGLYNGQYRINPSGGCAARNFSASTVSAYKLPISGHLHLQQQSQTISRLPKMGQRLTSQSTLLVMVMSRFTIRPTGGNHHAMRHCQVRRRGPGRNQ